MQRDTLCGSRIIAFDVGAQCRDVIDCLGRLYRGHDRVGVGFSSLLPRRRAHL